MCSGMDGGAEGGSVVGLGGSTMGTGGWGLARGGDGGMWTGGGETTACAELSSDWARGGTGDELLAGGSG